MNEKPAYETAVMPDKQLCPALVEAAFPAFVLIDGKAYDAKGLREALEEADDFRQQVARQYDCDSAKSAIDGLVHKIFPDRISIRFRSFDRAKLTAALSREPLIKSSARTVVASNG